MSPEHCKTIEWPDGYAIFDRTTGDTHVLDHLAGKIWQCYWRLGADLSATKIFFYKNLSVIDEQEINQCLKRLQAARLIAEKC